jgi:superfamily I DNA/RNA helicase
MAKLAISETFLQSYALLPKAQQKKAREFMEKFRADSTRASIHLEPIHGMADEKVRTARVGDDWRAVVVAPPKGDVFVCVWVDHHDEAMAWAKRKRFDVNPTTGALQVIELDAAPEAPPAPTPAAVSDDPATVPPGRLFAGRSREELARCGVPAVLLPAVWGLRTESDLDQLHPHLPAEVSDALYALASGSTIDEALTLAGGAKPTAARVDPNDLAQALEHPDSQRRFYVVESERELIDVLAAPLTRWRVFLHPSQRALVTRDANGPVRVLGGAGTGKTVVAMHRARHLAAKVFKGASERVLFTTFTRNLARDVRRHLDDLCGEERGRIDVDNLHHWAAEFLRARGVKVNVVDGDLQRALWDTALAEGTVGNLPRAFFREEWERVVQANDLSERDAYLKARRVGRGTPLSREQRAAVWRVMARYRAALDAKGLMESADIVREARLCLERTPADSPYRAVVIDETQDLRPADLRFLRALVPPSRNDLFLVGDAHQRIYGHVANLSACGIETRGRSVRLKVNYRTTEPIRAWAVKVLGGMRPDDLDGGEDDLAGYRSLRRGPAPTVHHFVRESEEAEAVLETVRAWRQQGPDREVCLAVRTKELIASRYLPLLKSAGIPAVLVQTKAEADLADGVRLATMHRVKGLEFPRVLLAGVQEGTVPLALSDDALPDAAAREDHALQERRLLFVAATRARDELVVTGYGVRSPLLP